MTQVAAASILLVFAVALAACGKDEPKDRVVAVEFRCGPADDELWGAACLNLDDLPSLYPDGSAVGSFTGPPGALRNRRQLVTVRGDRVVYTIAVPFTTPVAVGDPWPK